MEKAFGQYFRDMITIDSLFLNEDRHTHNMAVLRKADGAYAYCPFFDHGAALLADTMLDYPISGDIIKMKSESKPKSFCPDYDQQLDTAMQLYGQEVRFYFTKKDVEELLAKEPYYSEEIKKRVLQLIYYQMDKYSYLFDFTVTE